MTPTRVTWLTTALASSVLAGCGASSAVPAPQVRVAPSRCTYDTRLSPPLTIDVEVSCDQPLDALVASEAAMADRVEVRLGDGRSVQHDNARFVLPDGVARATYRIDLNAVAEVHRDIDIALACEGDEGRGWMTALSTWLLRPDPMTRTTRVSFAVEGGDIGFATAVPEVAGRYELLARQIRFSTYGVFGDFERERISVPGPFALGPEPSGKRAAVELVTLPGALATDSATRLEWVRDTAEAITEFWHGFPVEQAMVVVVPTEGHADVAHGKVVATAGAGVAIQLGAAAHKPDLYGDWILVHELFHLGFPSFSGEGKWLDEGLATYFEPIIRARAGWHTPIGVWGDFARDMSQGLPAVQQEGVENTQSFQGIYWGGAILALVADVETRRSTGGALGLEDGLRALLARGGDASHIWKLDEAIAVIDTHLATGGAAPNTLRKLADAHAAVGAPLDLPKLWADLGVNRTPSRTLLEEAAPLAQTRRAIIGKPPPSSGR